MHGKPDPMILGWVHHRLVVVILTTTIHVATFAVKRTFLGRKQWLLPRAGLLKMRQYIARKMNGSFCLLMSLTRMNHLILLKSGQRDTTIHGKVRTWCGRHMQ